ncbi:unnamed protein product [Danaus chrysippus]|uniref:(African queen) hypothetical protein n=1 Tax=Danaus chrysippus TaxID=151541 RepID=A0A8J2W0C6_9NEOP|nr:unnamed protein product [Danaus chrysippus]
MTPQKAAPRGLERSQRSETLASADCSDAVSLGRVGKVRRLPLAGRGASGRAGRGRRRSGASRLLDWIARAASAQLFLNLPHISTSLLFAPRSGLRLNA